MTSVHKRKFSLNQKSGLYFIVFIVAVGLILVLYFSNWKQDNSIDVNTNNNDNINQQNINVIVKNKNTNKLQKNKNANVNITVNANDNTNSSGGENINITEENLGIKVIGYDNVTKTSEDGITNLNLADGNNISITTEDYEGVIKNSISITEEENVIVDGVNGIKYTGGSMKDGSEVSMVIVKKDGKLYYFKGNDSFLDNLDNFVSFE